MGSWAGRKDRLAALPVYPHPVFCRFRVAMLAAIVIPVPNEAAGPARPTIANGKAEAVNRVQLQSPPGSLPGILYSLRGRYTALPYASGHSEPGLRAPAPTGASAVLLRVERGA